MLGWGSRWCCWRTANACRSICLRSFFCYGMVRRVSSRAGTRMLLSSAGSQPCPCSRVGLWLTGASSPGAARCPGWRPRDEAVRGCFECMYTKIAQRRVNASGARLRSTRLLPPCEGSVVEAWHCEPRARRPDASFGMQPGAAGIYAICRVC